jgi:L-proline amide hydrolase
MAVYVPLADIMGDTSHLVCEESTIVIRGLRVACFKYTNPNIDSSKAPLVALHGGPAFPHGYISPLKLLADQGYPVIFYDQCGCGKSSYVHVPQADAPWLLTVEYYIEELHAVLNHFKLDSFHLFGSSWGSMLAQEFAVLQPPGLKSLILDGPLADAQLYITSQWRDRISTLPTYSQNLLRKLTRTKQFNTPEYAALNEVLGKHFSCRVVPRPDVWEQCLKTMNTAIYTAMQGESEFTIGGVLEHWSVVDRLHLVQVPTLVCIGQYDSMTEECAMVMVNNIPRAWPLVIIPRAAHCKLMDEPQLCCAEFAKFLDAVESGEAK